MKRVLLVEDDEDLADLICEIVSSNFENLTIAPCVTASEAKALLESGPVEGIILDNQLPGCTGVDLLSEIRSLEKSYRDVPVILYSGIPPLTDDVEEKVFRNTTFLNKPVPMKELVDLVSKFLSTS